MTAYDILKEYYPDLLNKLNQKFPNIVKTSKEIEVISWRDEFNVADRNPEIIDNIEFLDELLKNNLISEEEYQEEVNKIRSYSSKTLGIAFIEDKIISFRERVPKKYVIVHEIGHIYFQEPDLTWNSSYGGGEILFWLAVEGKLNITEEKIKKYMELYRKVYEVDEEKLMKVYKEISKAITKGLDIPKDLIVAKLFAGTMPNYEIFEKYEDYEFVLSNLMDKNTIAEKIKNKEIKLNPKYLKSEILIFLATLSDGIIYNDPFYKHYLLNLIENIDEIEI